MSGPSDCPPDNLEQQQELDRFVADLEAEVEHLIHHAKGVAHTGLQHTYRVQQLKDQLKIVQDCVSEIVAAVTR